MTTIISSLNKYSKPIMMKDSEVTSGNNTDKGTKMKSYKEFLKEDAFPYVVGARGQEALIYLNPSAGEFTHLMREVSRIKNQQSRWRDEYDFARGLIDLHNDDLYVWNSYEANHDEVNLALAEQAGVESKLLGIYLFPVDYEGYHVVAADADFFSQEAFENNKNLKRLYGEVEVDPTPNTIA